MALQQQKIVLIGLPGAGKSRIQQHLVDDSNCRKLTATDLDSNQKLQQAGCYENSGLASEVEFCEQQQVWCVIDIRSVLPEQSWLQPVLTAMVNMADGVVFNFSEAASLDEQSWWGSWLKQNVQQAKPVVRCLNGSLPQDFAGFDNKTAQQLYQHSKQQLALFANCQCHEFQVDTVVLDHLLMGLDNSRQNLAMKITRVQAVLESLEYENPVELQGSAYRWDCYAAEPKQTVGNIVISGFELDKSWLQQLIDASRA